MAFHFDKQEQCARESRRRGDLRDELNAFLFASRPQDAYRVSKQVTMGENVSAEDWAQRGRRALDVGQIGDAMASFRQALMLDAKAHVPEQARREFAKRTNRE